MFGLSAAAVAAIGVGAAVVGSAAYSADKNRKLAHQQMDAAKHAAEDQAKAQAQSEIDAANAANARIAENRRRRRRANLGGAADALGAPSGGTAADGTAAGASPYAAPRPSVLAGGGVSAGVTYGGTPLGAGATYPGGAKNPRNSGN